MKVLRTTNDESTKKYIKYIKICNKRYIFYKIVCECEANLDR